MLVRFVDDETYVAMKERDLLGRCCTETEELRTAQRMGGGELADAETMHSPRLPMSGRFECKNAGEDHSERRMKERVVERTGISDKRACERSQKNRLKFTSDNSNTLRKW